MATDPRSTSDDPRGEVPPRQAPYQLAVFRGEEIRTFDLPASGEVIIGRENGHLGQVEERGQWTEQVLSAV